jgi:hypothetical protein
MRKIENADSLFFPCIRSPLLF